MKKVLAIVGIVSLFLTGCASLGGILGEPDIKMERVVIESLNLEGVTFRCDYLVKNPYPIGIVVKEVASQIIYEDASLVQIVTDEGLNLRAGSSNKNSIQFTLPYDSILRMASDSQNKSSLPFTLDGQVSFDLSAIPYAEISTLEIPFSKDFDVPVFKPQFKLEGASIQFPPPAEVAKALVASGTNGIKAAIVAGKIVLGQSVERDALEGVDLDVTILFDVALSNGGGAPWELEWERCAIDTGMGSLLDMELRSGSGIVNSSTENFQMAAVVSTLDFGSFLLGLAGGNLTDSSLVFESELSFPGFPYGTIPLKVEQELSASAFRFASQ